MSIKAPYLPDDRLRRIATEFLAEYHPDGTAPVPIESIVEFRFEMDIVPTPGLEESFDIVSYITSDLTTIHVDGYVYKKQPGRYRFSLAHELSHRVLHRDIFEQLSFNTVSEWKSVVTSIPSDQYSWIETHAYCLGGLILVPPNNLRDAFEVLAKTASEAGIDMSDPPTEVRRLAESHLARHFLVSADVIRRRMKADKLWKS